MTFSPDQIQAPQVMNGQESRTSTSDVALSALKDLGRHTQSLSHSLSAFVAVYTLRVKFRALLPSLDVVAVAEQEVSF